MAGSRAHKVGTIFLLALAGCADFSPQAESLTTAGIAAAVGSATGNVALGVIAGIAVALATRESVRYAERRIHGNVQNAIAGTAGPLAPGQAGNWYVEEELPLWGRWGTVQVARDFGEAIPCKDIVFTVENDRELYVTTICQNREGVWRWAVAEPTVRRWGDLQ
jgi:hypothetical protein